VADERPVLFKMWQSVIDSRTTNVCLHAAGMIRPLDEPFDTLAGQYQAPPAHIGCRALVVPHVPGAIVDMRRDANAELSNRPVARKITRGPRKGQTVNERRVGPPHKNERRQLFPTAKPGIFTEVPIPPPPPAVATSIAPAIPSASASVPTVAGVLTTPVATDPVLGAGALARIRHYIAQRRQGRVAAAVARLVDRLRGSG